MSDEQRLRRHGCLAARIGCVRWGASASTSTWARCPCGWCRMSDLPLCQTCGGSGRTTVPCPADTDSDGDCAWCSKPGQAHETPCPAGCVAVMAWQCFKGYEPRCSEANQGAHSTGWGCGSHPTHLDPAKVILWCEMHGDVKHEGYAFCMGARHKPKDPPCRLVVATYTIVGEPA